MNTFAPNSGMEEGLDFLMQQIYDQDTKLTLNIDNIELRITCPATMINIL
jgi:hypothetical protein